MDKPASPRSRRKPAAASYYTPASYRPDDSVAYLMRRVLASFAGEVEHELEPLGLTHAQWVPLYKLFLGHGNTGAELARECQLDAGAMTRMLDRLEAKGLLRRVRSAQDRRIVHLELTEAGRAAAGNIPQALCKVLNAHLRGVSREEWLLLKGLLHRLLDNGVALKRERERTRDEAA
ncbi:MarR family transcriptional regulator [Ramlibacter tataouinensis]|uniref:MarR family winged helix-turn-helix transcriptional regulator n=1 Tax=Ramlibacter tataouinensis TaxID=94132 RepID=UPI0022F390CA|nr:MarR family transcriptional regulator [Ramlibacter tataouinensis]WBY01485.1 MarR family transcriptional regulator [Ramlibacter tataouinensis]